MPFALVRMGFVPGLVRRSRGGANLIRTPKARDQPRHRPGCPMEESVPLTRRHALLATASLLATAAARAEDYPARPVELIVPFTAGGGSDLLARLTAEGLARRLGQPFLVVNRPGANTNIGML